MTQPHISNAVRILRDATKLYISDIPGEGIQTR
jgi:hypothetical protein